MIERIVGQNEVNVSLTIIGDVYRAGVSGA